MAEIQKGIVSSIEGEKARIKPYMNGPAVTHLVKFNKKTTVIVEGEKKEAIFDPPLKVGDVVTYVAFLDGTGHILGRL